MLFWRLCGGGEFASPCLVWAYQTTQPTPHGKQNRKMKTTQPSTTPDPVETGTGASPRTRRKRATEPGYTLSPLAQELKSDTTQNMAYDALKQAVLGGKFYPGTTVTLSKLSEMLGTSEMPIREALKRLTAERAFEALPNRSARIPILSRTVVQQILLLRAELESLAAAQAVENMSKRHIDQLTALDADMRAALDRQDLAAYVSLNMEFHFMIYRVADNEPLLSLIEALWLRMAPVVAANLTDMGKSLLKTDPGDRDHHANIIKAFQTHDAVAASAEIRADLLHPNALSTYRDESAVSA